MCVVKTPNWKELLEAYPDALECDDYKPLVYDIIQSTKSLIGFMRKTPFNQRTSDIVKMKENIDHSICMVESILELKYGEKGNVIFRVNKSELYYMNMTKLFKSRLCEKYRIKSPEDMLDVYEVDKLTDEALTYIDEQLGLPEQRRLERIKLNETDGNN